jgi:hypothetical protein
MKARLNKSNLRKLRNEIPIARVIAQLLELPSLMDEETFRFKCPICSSFHTATHSVTNLARCFACKRNFNNIDLVIMVKQVSFLDSVSLLQRMLNHPGVSKDEKSNQMPCSFKEILRDIANSIPE